MKKEETSISSMIKNYEKEMLSIDIFTNKVELLIKMLIDEAGLSNEVHEISSRTKDLDSFKLKVTQDETKYKNYTDVSDLSGIRVICYFAQQVDSISKIIEDNFVILPEYSVDKREILDPDRFGYVSLHLVVTLSDERLKLPEYKKYKRNKCEIQIRSVLQHAWAEIEHDLGYKAAIELPRDIRRRFCRLAGLLELADEEFDNIRKLIEDYSIVVEEKIITEPNELSIDKISLLSYIMNSTIVKEIEDELTVKEGRLLKTDQTIIIYPHWIQALDYVNINTIEMIDITLKQYKQEIITFGKQYYKLLGKSDRMSTEESTIGFSILLLAEYLIAQTKDIYQIRDFSETIWDTGTEEIQEILTRCLYQATE